MTERRGPLRHKTFIKGRIHFNNGLSSMDCIVRDVSESGSRIEVSEGIALPDAFEIYLPNKDEHFRAKVEWRKGDHLGISWTAERPSGQGNEPAELPNNFADRLAKLEREVASLRKRLDGLRES
jgi:PilZ domain